MREYTEIATQADLEKLLGTISRSHDSMTKEIRLINRGFVRPDHSMVGGHRFDGQLLVQSQRPPFAVELLICNILSLSLFDAGEHDGAEGQLVEINSPVQKREIRMRFDSSLSIHSERMFYAVRTDWLGPKARFRGDMPAPDAIPATEVQERWRQCSECSDAWEEDREIIFSICPSCRRLTEYELAVQTDSG